MTSAIRARREAEDGFTLIELLVVVIIIGILAAIAIPAFLNQRERAWQSELTSTVRNVALDVEAEATKFGGDYTKINTGNFDGFVATELEDLQGAPATPVIYDAANGSAATASFQICMSHAQLTAGSVTYDSDNGGVKDFVEGACSASTSG